VVPVARLHVISLKDEKVVQTVSLEPSTGVPEDLTFYLVPAGGQVQTMFAAAPFGKGGWRVCWPTPPGLALGDIARDSPTNTLPVQGERQLLTALEARYESGSLSFSPDGLFALVMQQRTSSAPIKVRAFDLDFDKRKGALAALKTIDDLVRKA